MALVSPISPSGAAVLAALSESLGHSIASIEEFTPFTFDVSPLQKAIIALARQMELCQKDTSSLRAELQELKVGRRLEALEQGLQELADGSRTAMSQINPPTYMHANLGTLTYEEALMAGVVRPDGIVDQTALANNPLLSAKVRMGGVDVASIMPGTPWAMLVSQSHARRSPLSSTSGTVGQGTSAGAAGGAAGASGIWAAQDARAMLGSRALQGMAPAAAPMLGADAGALSFEVAHVKERLTAMERKAEALWHVQSGEEDLRASVDRLRQDVQAVQAGAAEATARAAETATALKAQAAQSEATLSSLHELTEKLQMTDLSVAKSNDERRELAQKQDNVVGQIWDQLRHVEGSLAQRLTLAETSHITAMQEVDEAREATNDVLQRVDDTKRHVAGLETKLEGLNQQMNAAIAPIHNQLTQHLERLDTLAKNKQDAAVAVTHKDVDVAVAQAADKAERRADNIIKAIAGVERRIEALAEETPHKGEVVLTADLEALLTEHAQELDQHLDKLKADLLHVLDGKIDREEMTSLDTRLNGRVSGLEGAILKGLKAISDKVSAALAEKLDLTKFQEFKLQVRAILADVEDRLRDWSPAALGIKSGVAMDGSTGATTCLLCDTRVRAVRDLKAMGYSETDKVFSPERIPPADGLFPSIAVSRNPVLGAHNNARLAGKTVERADKLKGVTPAILMESIPTAASLRPGSPGTHAAGVMALSNLDPTAGVSLPQPGKGAIPSSRHGPQPMRVEVETVSGAIAKGQVPSAAATYRNAHRPHHSGGGPLGSAGEAGTMSPTRRLHSSPHQTLGPSGSAGDAGVQAEPMFGVVGSTMRPTDAQVAQAVQSAVHTPQAAMHLSGWESGRQSVTQDKGPS